MQKWITEFGTAVINTLLRNGWNLGQQQESVVFDPALEHCFHQYFACVASHPTLAWLGTDCRCHSAEA